jgi:hypothetical protein
MFNQLLQLAAHKKLIVGVCVHPAGPKGYFAEIWVGPSPGERTEWSDRFGIDIPQLEAINALAETAAEHMTRPARRCAAASVPFRSALSRDQTQPNVIHAVGLSQSDAIIRSYPGRSTQLASGTPPRRLASSPPMRATIGGEAGKGRL